MSVPLAILALLGALYLLSWSADAFVGAAAAIGTKARFHDYLTGSLIVGVGTSLPELVTSVLSVVHDVPEMVAPNVFGTVVANTFAGLGASVLFLHCAVRSGGRTRWVSLRGALHGGEINLEHLNPVEGTAPVAIFSVVVAYFLCRDGFLGVFDAVLLLLCYVVFLAAEIAKRGDEVFAEADASRATGTEPTSLGVAAFPLLLVVLFGPGVVYWITTESGRIMAAALAAGVVIVFAQRVRMLRQYSARHEGAPGVSEFEEQYLVSGGVSALVIAVVASVSLLAMSGDVVVRTIATISDHLGIASSKLSATVIALGTSLPDIIVAIIVTRRGRHSMLVGHIVQSNVFDVFLILGVCGLIGTIPVDAATVRVAIPFALGAYFVFLATLQDHKIVLSEGLLMMIGYGVFVYAIVCA